MALCAPRSMAGFHTRNSVARCYHRFDDTSRAAVRGLGHGSRPVPTAGGFLSRYRLLASLACCCIAIISPRSFSECTLVSLRADRCAGVVLLLRRDGRIICIVLWQRQSPAFGGARRMARVCDSSGALEPRANKGHAVRQSCDYPFLFLEWKHFLKPQPGVFEVKSSIEVNARPRKCGTDRFVCRNSAATGNNFSRWNCLSDPRGNFRPRRRRCAAFVFPRGLSWNRYSLGRAAFVTLQRNGNPAPMNELILTRYRTGSSARLFRIASGPIPAHASARRPHTARGTTWYSPPCGRNSIGTSGRTTSFTTFICACWGTSSRLQKRIDLVPTVSY